MRHPVSSVLVAVVSLVVLASGCSGESGDDEAGREPSATRSAADPSPTGTIPSAREGSWCDAVTDEMASEWYGRPVTVDAGASCSLQEEDFLEQDVNVLWERQADTDLSLAQVRRGLGVRSDDARRVRLAGGVPAWQVEMPDVHGVIIAMLVDDDLVSVFASSTLLEKPYRPIPELVAMARGIAEAYTA